MAKELHRDQVERVTADKPYIYGHGTHKVSLLDCGLKKNILVSLAKNDCTVTVYPCHTTAAEMLADNPDGIFLSPGPGDPLDVPYVISTVKELIGEKPIFGICLGIQMLSLALGAHTFKLPFGHRGSNHPVKDLRTGRVYITSQNHGYAVSDEGLPECIEVTHRSVNDGTIEGFCHKTLPIQAVQYHPEASPGPTDNFYLFKEFVKAMEDAKDDKKNVKKVLVIGSGPIVIGQAAEFDYAGTQACRSLKEEGMEVILVNSNPSTIMTDVDIADRVYIEPITLPFVTEVIKKERPDALLATLGGQVGLNMAVDLSEAGVLENMVWNCLALRSMLSSMRKIVSCSSAR